jgi:anti-sigma factor RsiW
MKHPQREDWIPYLFGEADPEIKKQLARHLSTCPGCAEELRVWRRSLQQLDAWKTPPQIRRRLPALQPVFQLAAAALIVLGIGFSFGRWYSPPGDGTKLRGGLEVSLKAALLPELRQQVRQDMANELQLQLTQLQQDSSNALAQAKAEAINASASDTAQALQEMVVTLRAERAEDRQEVASWVDNLRKQYETVFVSLRKDLETVASFADDEIRAARVKLTELAAANSSGQP